ncbi:MAG: hypothetical protein H7336_03890, partial [Bacteriovorax sp.]|nr:hypothetical protein [Bacteriovorax sp.]
LANCFKNKTKYIVGTPLTVFHNARTKTAAEAISLISQVAIGQMIELEELKKYAQEKYGKDFMPQECSEDSLAVPEKVGALGSPCMTNVIDDGYAIAQSFCLQPELGCRIDYLDFIKDKHNETKQESQLANFIKESSLKMSNIYISSDSDITKSMAGIMSNSSLSPEERAQNVLDLMSKNALNLDPVFKTYLDQSNLSKDNKKPDEFKKGLAKYIAAKKNNTLENVYKDLENLRMSEAKKFLKERCPSSLKMNKLCSITSDILSGAEVRVPEGSFNKMLSRKNSSSTFMNDPAKMGQTEMAEYVTRCNTFVLTPSTKSTMSFKESSAGINLSSGCDLFSDAPNGICVIKDFGLTGLSMIGEKYRTQITFNLDGGIERIDSGSIGIVEIINNVASTSAAIERTKETVLATTLANNESLPEICKRSDFEIAKTTLNKPEKSADAPLETISGAAKKTEENSRSASSSENNSLQPAQQPALGTKPFGNQIRPIESMPDSTSSSDFSARADVGPKSVSGNADYNQLLSKISGLEDRLAQAQKKTSAVAEKDSEIKTVSKKQEENELLQELKSAKAALGEISKSNTAKLKAVEQDSASAAKIKSTNRKDSSESSETLASSSPATTSQSTSRAIASVASAPRSAEKPEKASSVVTEEGKSSGGARTTTLADVSSVSIGEGIVLTRLDGVAKSKASETINSMIVAASGKPFYIEEGGMVKQIIPEIVDGKIIFNENGTPVYKTIVKGKIGEFKVESLDKKKSKKEVTKLTSPADLKMQEDKEKTSAVRYRELQEIFMLKK